MELKSGGGCKVLRSSMTEAEKMTEIKIAIVKRKNIKFAAMAAIDDLEIIKLGWSFGKFKKRHENVWIVF